MTLTNLTKNHSLKKQKLLYASFPIKLYVCGDLLSFSSHILIVYFIFLPLKDAGKPIAKAVKKESSSDEEESSDESDEEPSKPHVKVRESLVLNSYFQSCNLKS